MRPTSFSALHYVLCEERKTNSQMIQAIYFTEIFVILNVENEPPLRPFPHRTHPSSLTSDAGRNGESLLARTIPSNWIPVTLSFLLGSVRQSASNITLKINIQHHSSWMLPILVYWREILAKQWPHPTPRICAFDVTSVDQSVAMAT